MTSKNIEKVVDDWINRNFRKGSVSMNHIPVTYLDLIDICECVGQLKDEEYDDVITDYNAQNKELLGLKAENEKLKDKHKKDLDRVIPKVLKVLQKGEAFQSEIMEETKESPLLVVRALREIKVKENGIRADGYNEALEDVERYRCSVAKTVDAKDCIFMTDIEFQKLKKQEAQK